MNKDLYNKTILIPENVLNYLTKCFNAAKGADTNVEGFKRNQELRNSKEITYQQLKRIKNFFDNFSGDKNDLSYILNGGDYMKNWINTTLESLRNDVNLGKKVKSEVLPNQYITPHDKNDIRNMNRPSKSHVSATDYYNLQVTENLRRINDLIKKII